MLNCPFTLFVLLILKKKKKKKTNLSGRTHLLLDNTLRLSIANAPEKRTETLWVPFVFVVKWKLFVVTAKNKALYP